MNPITFCALVVAALLATDAIAAPVKEPEVKLKLKAGFCERDITPEIGMEQPGGYTKAFHSKFHDACKVRAAVFDDGTNRVALVGIDSLTIERDVVLAVRKEVEARCGIPGNAIMIGASHSHSSGPVGMVQPGQFDDASPLVKDLAYQRSSAADPRYLELVRVELINAICEANASRVEARCGFGSGKEDKAAFNRRVRMKNGMTFTHPGKGNPDIVDYAGPIDPEVGVIGVWDKQDQLIGCIVNYTCHATTNPGGISANWIYYLEKTIQGALGVNAPVVYLQGACGDITQVDNLDPHENPAAEKWAQLVGGRVGAEAVKVLLSVTASDDISLEAKSKLLNIKRRVPSPEKLKNALELAQKEPKQVGLTEWTFAKETVMLDALIAKNPSVEVEVQAIQVGPAVFVSNPAEYFVQYGLDIKKASKQPFTWVSELSNGCVGYVPTEEALGPHGGGYETRLTSYSNLEPTAGRKIADTSIELVNSLTPGKLPEPKKAPPFKAPWTYGNVPPELN